MEGPERRIRNLLSIKGLEANRPNLLKVALEEWQSSAEVFGKRVDKRQKEVRNIVNEIYQVIGFYSAFQGLLLTAVAQSNLLHCNNLGFPLALSALATFVALVGIGQKSWNILQFNRLIRSEDPTRRAYLNRVNKLKEFGTEFDFNNTCSEEDVRKPKESKYADVYSLLISYEGGLVATLILFGGLCLATIRQILCNPSQCP
ncbi:unnamed protein product [Sphagnum jensenii]|uniref:SMODS and SLOG-associating 2TM effector domain-containing protein n=1 Tax=Sphagnum jensenii TaxID=128206 RepID=A0ABP1AM83_9BRYO